MPKAYRRMDASPTLNAKGLPWDGCKPPPPKACAARGYPFISLFLIKYKTKIKQTKQKTKQKTTKQNKKKTKQKKKQNQKKNKQNTKQQQTNKKSNKINKKTGRLGQDARHPLVVPPMVGR